MSRSVTITTGCRLHFGLLVRGQPPLRTYGGLGLMVDHPRCSLTTRFAPRDEITAPPTVARRIEQLLFDWRSVEEFPAVKITIHEALPRHAGLGSGTQLALALASALIRLQDSNLTVQELARRTGRSQRSSIGTKGFAEGGLILDDGQAPETPGPALTTRCDFPADWRFVIVTPPSQQGLSGDSERIAFRQMDSMSDRQLFQLNELRTQCFEAMKQKQFARSSQLLYEFGRGVGEYFAQFQGDIFSEPRMAILAEKLRTEGIQGVGQSSWGPTLFALCESPSDADTVASSLRGSPAWSDCTIQVVAGKNTGARIDVAEISSGDSSR